MLVRPLSLRTFGLLTPLLFALAGCNSKDPGERLLTEKTDPPRIKNPQITAETSKGQKARPTTPDKSPFGTQPPKSDTTGETPIDPKMPVDPPIMNPDEDPKDPPEKDPPLPKGAKAIKDGLPIYIETRGDGTKVVHVMAEVCLRQGPLEVLLTRQNRKEHEAILRVDVDGRMIHTALLAIGAEAGTPTQFQPKYKPATGTQMKISLTYNEKANLKTVPAQTWVYDAKNKKDMNTDWVFAGSRFLKDPDAPPNDPPYYLANNGEFISLANFPDSMLDIPVESSKDDTHRYYEAHTKRIPPLGTKVLVTFEPVLKKK